MNILLKKIYNKKFDLFGTDNYYLTKEEGNNANHSIEVIPVTNVQVIDDKVNFTYKRKQHILYSITDPRYRGTIRKIPKAWIVVSIPDQCYYVDNKFYKFISTVIIRKTTLSSIFDTSTK